MNKLAKLILDDVATINHKVDLSSIDNKTVLITGATGLIGTYLTALLKTCRDSGEADFKLALTAYSEPDSYYYDFLDTTKDVFIKGDLTDGGFVRNFPSADTIIHAAGYGQPGKFMNDPLKTLKLNTLATFNLFEKLNKEGNFLFISSSEVYNGSIKIPYKEEDIGSTNTDNFRSCYIEGKRCGEAICFAYRQKGVSAKIARLSLAYGPGTKKTDQRVLNNFIAKGLDGKIDLMDLGQAHRTYCYVTDAIEILLNIIINGKDFIYNVGGQSKTTIGDLAKKIGAIMGVPVVFPEKANTLAGAPEDVSLDLTKIKEHFKKEGFIGLDEGLVKTVAWQKILYGNL
jgi:nucleoside-diphosphate-sugar epimerase